MKKLLLVVITYMISNNLIAQKILPNEASQHIGDTVTVCGKIYGGKYFEGGNKITLLNMGDAYPRSPLTLVITAEDRTHFTNAPEEFYSNKNICITGVVKEYKGKPQIFIHSEKEITTE